ncbi:hypothetical protein [Paenibacillus hexagrammi]|uniref:MucB/RseB N-terminal domain-containing protein n=1 Tax=Paenibacillus hexagrammi TaxID=2908839 RepID=A0ABY3SFV8_9BACL|nr:hypothetical protein [Paenibacillus sp. YPD9-1]UJF32909.1 hypothetical protein L0M14_25585 [Paenibacillus sp. YPD9-1]
MNTPDSDDVHKELQSGPLKVSGFTPELERNIEAAIDRKERAKPRTKLFLFIGGLGAISAAVLLFPWGILNTKSDAAAATQLAASEGPQIVTPAPVSINSALLIGLRTEQKSTDSVNHAGPLTYSTYRTMLIAPVRGKLRKTSEGSGILMPYKMNFWKIDSLVQKTASDEIHYLSAHLADQPVKPETFTDDPEEKLNRIETLLFAGNQYLSIAESEQGTHGKQPYQASRIWVRTLPQLKEGHTLEFYKKPTDPNHVAVTDVYDPSISGVLNNLSDQHISKDQPMEINGQSWTVERAPGRWVGKIAQTPLADSTLPDQYILHDWPRDLPDKVVNHDELASTWMDIKTSWPKATDALTSPLNDMIVIFEEGKLKFYPYGQAPNNDPQLTIDLKPNEKLVMAQWATDHYVQEWIDKTAAYLAYASPAETGGSYNEAGLPN